MIICKHFKFSAAHKLVDYKGKCKNLHGHTWYGHVTIELKGGINCYWQNGMAIDFNLIKKEIENRFDHKFLNNVIKFNPTAENIASAICILVDKMMFDLIYNGPVDLQVFTSVKLYESDTSSVEVEIKEAYDWFNFELRRDGILEKIFGNVFG